MDVKRPPPVLLVPTWPPCPSQWREERQSSRPEHRNFRLANLLVTEILDTGDYFLKTALSSFFWLFWKMKRN